MQEHYGSRSKAAQAISDGLVLVNGKPSEASYSVKETDEISFLEAAESYVSAGGFKLAKALRDFSFSVQGFICADIGASNGGFTDCLFQNGAKKVYCIDVGENQLDKSLLDKNVVIIDNCNARNLCTDIFKDSLDLVTIDVSFISLTYILGAVSSVLQDGRHVLALIKPQFEMDSPSVGKNGIVRDPRLRKRAVSRILGYAATVSLAPQRITEAPRREGKNVEYVVLLEKSGTPQDEEKLLKAVGLQ